MQRIKLITPTQRKFLDLCISNLDCVSLRGLLDYGFEIKYDALKSYYSTRRLLPKDFFDNICVIAKINKDNLKFKIIDENWGKSKGGKTSKRTTALRIN